jgi:hypothetical protein
LPVAQVCSEHILIIEYGKKGDAFFFCQLATAESGPDPGLDPGL